MRMHKLLFHTTSRNVASITFKRNNSTTMMNMFKSTPSTLNRRQFSFTVNTRQEKETDEDERVLERDSVDSLEEFQEEAELFNIEEGVEGEEEEIEEEGEVANPAQIAAQTYEQKSQYFGELIDSEKDLIEEEPVNYVPASYERVKQYVDAQDALEKKENEDEDYRYEDPMIPRKKSAFGQWTENQIIKNQEELLNYLGFSEYAPVVTKDIIEDLQRLPKEISNFVLIDVRGRYPAKHYNIPGSVNIPLKELTAAFELTDTDFVTRYGVPKPDAYKSIIFFSEDMIETEFACVLLSTLTDGYELVYNYRGGVQDWFGAGYKQLWRRSFVSDYNLLVRQDNYGKIEESMLKQVKKLTGEEEEE